MYIPGEAEVVLLVLALAERYGHGNLMSRLSAAWAAKLFERHPHFDTETAIRCANGGKNERARFGHLDREEAIRAMRRYTFQEEPEGFAAMDPRDRRAFHDRLRRFRLLNVESDDAGRDAAHDDGGDDG